MRGLTNMVTHDQNSGGLSAKAIAAANAAAAMSNATAKANSKNYVPSEFSEADAATNGREYQLPRTHAPMHKEWRQI